MEVVVRSGNCTRNRFHVHKTMEFLYRALSDAAWVQLEKEVNTEKKDRWVLEKRKEWRPNTLKIRMFRREQTGINVEIAEAAARQLESMGGRERRSSS